MAKSALDGVDYLTVWGDYMIVWKNSNFFDCLCHNLKLVARDDLSMSQSKNSCPILGATNSALDEDYYLVARRGYLTV